MEIKDCNVVTNASMIFNQIVKNTMKSYENTRKITRAQGDDYSTGCLLYYHHFQKI